LKARFTTQHDGYPAAVINNSVEFHNFTLALKSARVSFLTKIVKPTRRRGREFVVMLVSDGA
jgi:hypothetical protein